MGTSLSILLGKRERASLLYDIANSSQIHIICISAILHPTCPLLFPPLFHTPPLSSQFLESPLLSISVYSWVPLAINTCMWLICHLEQWQTSNLPWPWGCFLVPRQLSTSNHVTRKATGVDEGGSRCEQMSALIFFIIHTGNHPHFSITILSCRPTCYIFPHTQENRPQSLLVNCLFLFLFCLCLTAAFAPQLSSLSTWWTQFPSVLTSFLSSENIQDKVPCDLSGVLSLGRLSFSPQVA